MDGNSSQAGENKLPQIDYLKITILGFGLSALWATLHAVILPLRLLDFVPEVQKNTYLDLLILAGLFLAILVQPVAGAISDRSGFRWGRRRPFILIGCMLLLLFLPGIGFSAGYVAILLVYCLLQVSSNIAQGPFQGFIPDMIPRNRRGTASGWRGLMQLIGGVVLIRLTAPFMDRYLAENDISGLWLTLGVLAALLLAVLVFTLVAVKERPGKGAPSPFQLSALYRSYRIDTRALPGFVTFLVACLLIFLAWGILTGHALYFLTDVLELPSPVTATGNLLIVVAVSLLVVVYPAGRLSDRFGRKPIAVSSGLLGALGIAALYISTFITRDYTHIMLSGALLGLCGGAWVSTQWALATDLVARGEEARYLGLVNISVAGAGALSRLTGPAIDYFNGIALNLGYAVMLLICFICFIAGSILLVRTRVPDNAGSGHRA